ncbi:lipid droplet-regulating VLDL assembly factor AUP1-like isoform X2 [Haliotis rufescens]|uniref:lipid droplet-regulating VLDL assembly factor AUP1-like isoform X1 n=1 Tax=Haliotis rufescens TaxID=6454 RepID=UPI001EAFD6BC|nr:lipid droplet-regulating VLDL assembly factor AUP1-like isoform X1 [Haliotis rufescens]XP_048258545.1 lipid droplet-regulating VLDL assembly factor AUP1-like isoform X2 [Haliotis rufescens]
MEIRSLLELNRLPDGISMVPIILYFPLGLVLAVLRFFISLHALLVSFLLPKTWFIRSVVLRFMFGVAGIIISTDGDENRDKRARILVCDHISPLDHLVTSLVVPHVCLLDWHFSSLLQWVTGCQEISPDKNKEEVVKYVKSIYSGTTLPLLFFPEKTTTSGKIGLLKFWSLPFELGHLIQPITIQANRIDIFKVNVSTVKSAWWSDLFWCLFVPYTIFKLRYLPVTEKKEAELCEEFSERVRQNMCRSLGVAATSYTHSDKTDYLKRQSYPLPATPVPNNTAEITQAPAAKQQSQGVPSPPVTTSQISVAPEVKVMVDQVKTVLPHVPIATIIAELDRCEDVDVVITNILEGNVEFTPEEVQAPDGNSVSPPTQQTVCPSQLTFKSDSFGRNAGNRHLSLEDRKKAMYEAARKRYKEKHNIL